GDLVEAGKQRAFVRDLLRRRLGDRFIRCRRRGVGRLRRAARLSLTAGRAGKRRLRAERTTWIDCSRGPAGRWRQRSRLHGGLALAGILLVRVWLVPLVGVLLAGILALAAARHAGRWARRRTEKGFERIDELCRGRKAVERDPCRD